MHKLFYLTLLAVVTVLAGCTSPITCDGRGPSEYCEIHHTLMEQTVVKRKVNPTPSREYLEARAKEFRHSYPFALPEQCDSCLVYICDDCARAEAEWLRRHPQTK